MKSQTDKGNSADSLVVKTPGVAVAREISDASAEVMEAYDKAQFFGMADVCTCLAESMKRLLDAQTEVLEWAENHNAEALAGSGEKRFVKPKEK